MDKFERLDMNLHLNFSPISFPKVPGIRGAPRINFLSIPSLTTSVKSLFKTSKSKAKPQSHSYEIPAIKSKKVSLQYCYITPSTSTC